MTVIADADPMVFADTVLVGIARGNVQRFFGPLNRVGHVQKAPQKEGTLPHGTRHRWLRGPAITEIDSPPIRSGRRLIAEPVSSVCLHVSQRPRRMGIRWD